MLIKLANLTLTNNSKQVKLKLNQQKKCDLKKLILEDIKIDFKKLEDFEKETEISVSFGSEINEIINLKNGAKFNSWFLNFLDHHEKEKRNFYNLHKKNFTQKH